jgi:hypothetical protein
MVIKFDQHHLDLIEHQKCYLGQNEPRVYAPSDFPEVRHESNCRPKFPDYVDKERDVPGHWAKCREAKAAY